MKNFYDILRVERDASEQEIEESYRFLCKAYHPDKHRDDPETGAAYFKQVQQAYEILKNPDKRAKHDAALDEENSSSAAGALAVLEDLVDEEMGAATALPKKPARPKKKVLSGGGSGVTRGWVQFIAAVVIIATVCVVAVAVFLNYFNPESGEEQDGPLVEDSESKDSSEEVRKGRASKSKDAPVHRPLPLVVGRFGRLEGATDIERLEVTLGGKLVFRLYQPMGPHKPRSLPLVLLAADRENFAAGARLTARDREQHLPWARAGFAAIAYPIDGALPRGEAPDDDRLAATIQEFSDAEGGVQNARAAMYLVGVSVPRPTAPAFVEVRSEGKKFSQLDLNRVYTAGRGYSASVALRLCAELAAVRACVAVAPISDIRQHLGDERLARLSELAPQIEASLQRASPLEFALNIRDDVFLFHSEEDELVSVAQSQALSRRIPAGRLKFVIVSAGAQRESTLNEGIPRGIDWLQIVGKLVDRLKLSQQLERQARQHFILGEDRAGFDKLYARALLGEDDATWLSRYRWCPFLKRPVTSLRLGFAVEIDREDLQRAFTIAKFREPPKKPHARNREIGTQMGRLLGRLGDDLVMELLQRRIDGGRLGGWGIEPKRKKLELRRLMLLGVGDREFVLSRARDEKVDLIVIAHWKPKALGQGGWDAAIRLKIVDPQARDGRLAGWRSKRSLSFNRYETSRAKGLKYDDAKQVSSDLGRFLNDKVALTAMPGDVDALLRLRSKRLTSSKTKLTLADFAELRLYRELEVLTEDEVLAALQRSLGQVDGRLLLRGTLRDRSEILNRILASEAK